MADLPRDLDPLAATTRQAQLVSRQLYEPLVAELSGPYGDASRQSGLAQRIRPSRDRTIWTLHLRSGVRFQDGEPFNASAVLANVRRWRSLPQGSGLLPSLFAVDAPRPDLVRFVLTRPTPELPRQLTSPRLGIVSPDALRPRSGIGAEIADGPAPGTGPFELQRAGAGVIALERYGAWWGSATGLGPALDGVEFRAVASEDARLRALGSGQTEIADGLSGRALAQVSNNPLLTTIPGGIGLERSVRGLEPEGPTPLSGVWLTTVVGG